jgi:hypothetical protein
MAMIPTIMWVLMALLGFQIAWSCVYVMSKKKPGSVKRKLYWEKRLLTLQAAREKKLLALQEAHELANPKTLWEYLAESSGGGNAAF